MNAIADRGQYRISDRMFSESSTGNTESGKRWAPIGGHKGAKKSTMDS